MTQKKTQQTRAPLTANRWGIAHAEVRDGRIEALIPIAEDPAPSPLLPRLAALYDNPLRIRRPAVRRSYLELGAASRDRRGEDEFVEVSWDTALELAAKALRETYAKHGPDAVWGHSYGWMNTGLVQGSRPLLHRLLNILGGFVPLTNSYSTGAITAIQTHIVGAGMPRPSDWEDVLEHSERVVFWGCDPMRTDDVDWFTALHRSRAAAARLKDHPRIKCWSINPMKSDTALAVGATHVQPLPGTDAALMLGVIHELISTGKADFDFLKRYTHGADPFIEYVLGKTDATPKTPEWAAKIAAVPAETIRALAADMAAHRTMIMIGWGSQRQEHGEQAPWLAWTLAAFLGQIGLPGGGIGATYHYSSGGSTPGRGPGLRGIATDPTGAQRVRLVSGVRPLPVASITDCLEHPGKTIDFNGESLTYPDVQLVFWAGGNPLAHHPDTNRLTRALKRPAHFIVADINWTPTARMADIVLPACTNFEMSDITRIGSNTNDGIVFTEAVLPAFAEARDNYAIMSGLAEKLGIKERFTEGLSPEGWRQRLYAEAYDTATSMGLALPSYEEAKAAALILYPHAESEPNWRPYISMEDFRTDPLAHPLKTPSGKIEISSINVERFGYEELTAYPRYMPPQEGAGKTSAEYPFVLLTPKSPRRLHSQLDSSLTSTFGAEPCYLNPADAASLGIAEGDTVLVSSRRGRTLLAAHLTERLRPGVVAVDNGSWYRPEIDPEYGLIDSHGAANTLTLDVPTSRIARGNVASSASVSVVKYHGPLSATRPLDLPKGISAD